MTSIALRAFTTAGALTGLLIASAAAFSQTTPPRPARVEDEVLAQTRRYFDALKASDVPELERLLAPDYVEVSPLGELDSRAQVIGFYRIAARAKTGQASELTAIDVDESTVAVYGDAAVAVVRATFRMKTAA
jgi:ketosteroid isomerase-like protein